MLFIETSIFTRQVTNLLSDDEYRQLQSILAIHPAFGAIIPHSGGLRKIRWGLSKRGKRGGVRAIYYWVLGRRERPNSHAVHVTEKDDLTQAQLKVLREVVEKEFK